MVFESPLVQICCIDALNFRMQMGEQNYRWNILYLHTLEVGAEVNQGRGDFGRNLMLSKEWR